MIDRLPPELLIIAVKELPSPVDTKSLCEVSHHLHKICTPLLHESVVITVYDVSPVALAATIRSICRASLEFTRHIAFTTPLLKYHSSLCHHGRLAKKNWTYADYCGEPLGVALEDLLSHFRPNQLRSFRWDLGICPPFPVLDLSHPWRHSQRRIEHLSLVVDPKCSMENRPGYITDLTAFQNLRYFSWVYPTTPSDFQAIGAILRTHGSRLQGLKLDFGAWWRVIKTFADSPDELGSTCPPSVNTFTEEILGIKEGATGVILPSLQELDLANLSFETATTGLARALNIANLRSLTINDCRRFLPLLVEAAESTSALPLKRFALRYPSRDDTIRGGSVDVLEECLLRFLNRCTALEDIFLAVFVQSNSTNLIRAIANNRERLRRLVVHWSSDPDDDYDEPCTEADTVAILNSCPAVECLGLCVEVPVLRQSLEGISPRPRYRLLHVRNSATSLHLPTEENWLPGMRTGYQADDDSSFLNWVFGVDGIGSLEILAFGDFSCDEGGGRASAAYCREADGYRRLTPNDSTLWAYLKSNMDMLSSCSAASAPVSFY
ncbi:uncharacterized protein BJX67DRAFT_320079 [Aspergillus lucknowensis]|uniref:F-box domain-containing protein n=1 Tax=Aspergillus lucknowensis TaxID=176173 RepID=A0ABR4M2B4_9EURO